jgi:hypothetical protein
MYDFSDDQVIGKFIKDVICFSNTIRSETSYIIIGVGENGDKSKNLIGIESTPDDSLFQDKIKDKVHPRPIFSYYTIQYQSKQFGVFEFPVSKYPLPLYPIVKIKGLEVSRIYYRKGTTNTEAIGHEIITIASWLQSLPEPSSNSSIHEYVSELIKRLTIGSEKLSTIFVDLLLFARKHNLKELITFCSEEIKGLDVSLIDTNSTEYSYRVQNVTTSMHKIEINPFSYIRPTESMVRNEIEKNKDFYSIRMFFFQPITEIEEHLGKFEPGTLCLTTQASSKQLFKDKKGSDYPVFIYAFKDSYTSLYRDIKQKAVDKLMKV